jgi:hypothetical protein
VVKAWLAIAAREGTSSSASLLVGETCNIDVVAKGAVDTIVASIP